MVPQVVAGYTGTLTGLRETVGQTHGQAQAMLGRMSPAFIPMYRREDIVGDKMGICRSGYPSFVRADTEWSRRPTTAMRPLVKDPLARESGMDIAPCAGPPGPGNLSRRRLCLGTWAWQTIVPLLEMKIVNPKLCRVVRRDLSTSRGTCEGFVPSCWAPFILLLPSYLLFFWR